MEYTVFAVANMTTAQMKTEILYDIARVKVDGGHLIVFQILALDAVERQRYFRYAKEYLKKEKKKGNIQVYIEGCDLGSETMESVYLLNKHPSLENDAFLMGEDRDYILVRV